MRTYQRGNVVSKYDLLRDVPKNIKEEYAQILLSRVNNSATILDVGCGTGNVLVPLAKLAKDTDIKVIGVDTSKKMCAEVKRKVHNAKVIHSNLTEFCASNRQPIDLLHFKAMLHCLDSVESFMLKAMSAVRVGGLIVTAHEVSQTEAEIEMLKYAGDVDDEIHRVFQKYFKTRSLDGNRFVPRKFPAGNSQPAIEFILKYGDYVLEKVCYTSTFYRRIKISDILDAIRYGTFGVFDDDSATRKCYYRKLLAFYEAKKVNINRDRLLPCKFKINILRRTK